MVPELNGDFIQWLRGFYYTVEAGSLVGATAIMHRNQSAITYQIQSLESMYGVPLFTSSKGKRALTEEGKFLYAKALELFGEISSIRNVIGQASQETASEIRIAAPNSILVHYLPHRISAFRMQCPGSGFILEGVSTTQIALRMLSSRQADFAICCYEVPPDNFEVRHLFSSNIMLLTPKTGPYAFVAPKLEQLTEVPFIAPPAHSELGRYLRSQLAYMGMTMRNEILSSDTAGAMEFVAEGLGIAFARDFSLAKSDSERFNIVPMTPPFKSMSYGVAHRKFMSMTYLHETFLACLEQPSAGKKPPAQKKTPGRHKT